METRGSDSIFRHVLRCIFVSSLFLSVVPPGVSGKCSLLSSKFSNVMIEVDWWSILPYSSHEKGKKGNYTYNGKFKCKLIVSWKRDIDDVFVRLQNFVITCLLQC